MLFRLWFYLCKIAILGFALTILGIAKISIWSQWFFVIGLSILVPLCLCGALVAILFCLGWRWACPFCGEKATLSGERNKMIIKCPRCGSYQANIFYDWRFKIMEDCDE
jgi:hypothetical protein